LETPDHLRAAVDLLVLLARWLPPGDAQATIPRLLFCRDPFLDFCRSGPTARGVVLVAAFQLLQLWLSGCRAPGSSWTAEQACHHAAG
jgi:hypothetical protein